MSAPAGYRYRLIEKYAWDECIKALQSVTTLQFNLSGSVAVFTIEKQQYVLYNKITSLNYCIKSGVSSDSIHCIVDNLATLNQPADLKGGIVRKVFLKLISDTELRSWQQQMIDIEKLLGV
jgi:hypothetical protein